MPFSETAQREVTSGLLSAYQPVPGVPDELFDSAGAVRPVWRPLVEALLALSPPELEARKARGDRYLRDAGVFYRQYGPGNSYERDWPLSHMPLLLDEAEWATIAAGLRQRADLLEQVVADLYGNNRLVSDGYLPAELVAGNPEWLRPLVGVRPRGGHYLHFLAFDIGRGPQGQWWVIGDRTQAPSGAGFALENRIATGKIYSDLFGQSNVHRLAGFFRTFRDALQGLRGSEDSRAAILTPGPLNETYFEHAYIARYLGMMLVEGEDLTVRDGELMVRTVAGLRPISVLWRRMDAKWTDPLELNQTSQIGTPGMLGAIRSGTVTMVNALGSGVLEARAFLAFLPRISERLMGEPLALPNIATWWCGQPSERDYVRENAGRMTIGGAFATRLLFDLDDVSAVGGAFNRDVGDTVENWIDRGAGQLVGQEAITLSTAPAFDGERLVPRPMSLRIFLVRTPDGWEVMPGGFARIGHSATSAALAMQHGGSAADVWVVAPKSVEPVTLLATPGPGEAVRQQPGVLPSRAADNLYWLGRYVERAENAIRVLRSFHLRLAEMSPSNDDLLKTCGSLLLSLGIDPAERFPGTLITILKAATEAASHVRDRFSLDGWYALHDLDKTVSSMATTASPGDDMARAMSVLLRKISGFSGLVHDNMYHFTGWRFLGIGKALERGILLCTLLEAMGDPEAPDGSLDFAIEAADSSMSHRRRYVVATSRETVVDLLGLDPLNPRSIIFQLNEIEEHVGYLPNTEFHKQLSPLQRALLQTKAALAAETPETLDGGRLADLRSRMAVLSDHLGTAYLR